MVTFQCPNCCKIHNKSSKQLDKIIIINIDNIIIGRLLHRVLSINVYLELFCRSQVDMTIKLIATLSID